jgi:hypothetical protein
MRLIIINVIMAIASLMIMGFGFWTYNQSLSDKKVLEYFRNKPVTAFKNLKTVSALSDRMVIIKGEIAADETFTGKDGQKVVLERIQEETKDKNSNRGWKEVKESRFFKLLPFWIKENSNKVLVDGFGLDKTFLGNPEIKTDEQKDQFIRTKKWTMVPGQVVYVLGNIENKGGQLIINSPNLYASGFNPFAPKEPFVITSWSLFEITSKALELSQNVYYMSLALFAVGAFFLFSSISNIFKNYGKIKND